MMIYEGGYECVTGQRCSPGVLVLRSRSGNQEEVWAWGAEVADSVGVNCKKDADCVSREEF